MNTVDKFIGCIIGYKKFGCGQLTSWFSKLTANILEPDISYLFRKVIEMKNIQEQQAHESHSHDHSHDHDHGKMPIISYFIGLVLAIIGLFK